MYDREQRMKLFKEQDEEEDDKRRQEYDSSEEEDDEENFVWLNSCDPSAYLVLASKNKNLYEKDQQIFHCYGRRTNRFLLVNYGFVIDKNKYNSLSFRVWVNFDWKKRAEAGPDFVQPDDDDAKISKIIRLKQNKLNEDIFAYLRANLLNSYTGHNTQYLLISSPVDVNFEMLVVACAINLLKGL